MTEWHIKEISDLTSTSVRMLRHYDKIGLLKQIELLFNPEATSWISRALEVHAQ